MEILALYLPQYHRIKENDVWWGEGYTEWTAVKRALKYINEQVQPRIPKNNNYYDLSDESGESMKEQAKIAKKYGIDGFVFYHYWFESGKQLLEKPMEIFLKHPEIDIKFAICWANETWSRNWYGLEKEILMEQKYGDKKEWCKHFMYLLPFFKDERYIKIENKPMINIYHSKEIEKLEEMIVYWNQLAIEHGFSGVYIVSANTGSELDNREEIIDAYYNFEPSYSLIHKTNFLERKKYEVSVLCKSLYNKISEKKTVERKINGVSFIRRMIRPDRVISRPVFPGVFPQWDNTPRRLYSGTFFSKMSPDLFLEQLENVYSKYRNSQFLFVNAWNEWGEGAYLEADELNNYQYLEKIFEFKNKIGEAQ